MGFVPLLLFLGGVDETVLSAKEQQLLDALSPTAEAQGIEIVTVDIVGSVSYTHLQWCCVIRVAKLQVHSSLKSLWSSKRVFPKK